MLEIFENNGFTIRVVGDNQNPLFVASDVCKALEIANSRDAIASINTKAKGVVLTDTLETAGGKQKVNVLTEQGLYLLVMQSRKPSAIEFQLWVTGEVLPQIRKHGAYMTPEKIEEVLSNPDVIIRLATQLKEEHLKRKQAESKVNILTHTNKTYTATEIAKEIGFKSAIALNKDLHERGITFKQNGTWLLYSKYADMALQNIKQEVLDSGKIVYYTRWTGLGREFLMDLYRADA